MDSTADADPDPRDFLVNSSTGYVHMITRDAVKLECGKDLPLKFERITDFNKAKHFYKKCF